jgi:hypothetical protein
MWNCEQNLAKLQSFKFYEHPFGGSEVVSCIEIDGGTE